MSTNRITLTGGPLDGKRYDVPHTATQIPADGGTYQVTEQLGTWESTDAEPDEQTGTAKVDIVPDTAPLGEAIKAEVASAKPRVRKPRAPKAKAD